MRLAFSRSTLPKVIRSVAPTATDVSFAVPTLWLDTTANKVYILTDVTGGVATWDYISGLTATLDTDGALAANSDTRIASQKAVKTYVASQVTAVGVATVGAADCENIIEDLSYYPPVTFTWDPGSLADGAGETSAAVSVPGVSLGGAVVQCIAPYDLQGITLNAYVDAADSCKARLQNETTGTINLASGTWIMQARRI